MYPERIYGEETVTVVFSTRRAQKHLRNTATSTMCRILLKAQIKVKGYCFVLIHGSSTSQVHFFTQTLTQSVDAHWECTHLEDCIIVMF